jgi:serine/threonine protein kinase
LQPHFQVPPSISLAPAHRRILTGLHFGYQIVSCLGDGAHSRVYLAIQPRTSQAFALKHVISESEKQERYVDQAQMEWTVSQRIKSPIVRGMVQQIVKPHHSQTGSGRELALVMEMIDAPSLDSVWAYPFPTLLRIFLDTARGLQAICDAGFVHADMKPDNILFTANGRTRVIDLGQAVKIGTIKPRMSGSPGYVAPEQPLCQAITSATDSFSFGATMYKLLSGTYAPQAFRDSYREGYARKDRRVGQPTEVRGTGFSVPDSLARLVIRCLHQAPSSRPVMAQIVLELTRLVDATPGVARA